MLQLNCEVLFAGNDRQQTFLASILPGLRFLSLEGYNVSYGKGALMPALLRQIPGLMHTVRREHRWLRELVDSERIDGIISDNRYGLWHTSVPSVILTHQLQIKTGFGRLADNILRHLHYRYLERFGACWIVDVPGASHLGGSLSHPAVLPRESSYIGWISQLKPPGPDAPGQHLLVLLSGPEPQRSIFSDLLWQQACALTEPVVFVEGSSTAQRTAVPSHIRHIPRAGGDELQSLIEQAHLVVCRSGYSTLMDLVLLQKKAILVPTPGQTEQEYLAQRLSAVQMFLAAPQKGFELSTALEAAGRFPYKLPRETGGHERFQGVVDAWVRAL